jgi:hypothetical protein
VKSKRFIQAGHMARMGETRNAQKILVGKPLRRQPLERSEGDGKITLG